LQELKALKDDNNAVYKLVGPTLLKQDRTEAQQNIEKRIEYIKGEM
jgi:prefoldin beta subunit